MKNRDIILKAIIIFLKEEMRNECKDDLSRQNIEKTFESYKSMIELSADMIIMEYEKCLFKQISEGIISNLKGIFGTNELLMNDLLHKVITTIRDNYSDLTDNILNMSELQRRIRIQILEDEIENCQLDIIMLKKHQEVLDKIAKKEANKESWYFVLLALISLIAWIILIYLFRWDILEKWTFLSGIALILLNAIIYAIFGGNIFSETFKKERFEKRKSYNYDLHKFDTSFLERFDKTLQQKKNELKELACN
jgi:hypothetical protein